MYLHHRLGLSAAATTTTGMLTRLPLYTKIATRCRSDSGGRDVIPTTIVSLEPSVCQPRAHPTPRRAVATVFIGSNRTYGCRGACVSPVSGALRTQRRLMPKAEANLNPQNEGDHTLGDNPYERAENRHDALGLTE